jgi:hypothetical protein
MSQNMIYNFDNNSDLKRWVIVNDDVMGGISSSDLIIENDGNGVFEGRISTAYNCTSSYQSGIILCKVSK